MDQEVATDSKLSLDVESGTGNSSLMLTQPYHLYVERVDPDRNMARFYTLAIQPTLFGGASVIRNWGRIGSNGQTMMETFDSQEDADTALSRLERTKRKRGYRNVRCAK